MQACHRHPLALVGIGNTITGDDAAGIVALEHLQKTLWRHPSLLFLTLQADLYEISEYLSRANHFIFIDAVAGNEPGHILKSSQIPRAHAPSFHQTDIGGVMTSLEKLEFVDPFPSWEIWGITILPPTEVKIGVTPIIQKAIQMLGNQLTRHVRSFLQQEVSM